MPTHLTCPGCRSGASQPRSEGTALAAAGLKPVVVSTVVVSIAELAIVDLHPLLVLLRITGAGPANELGDSRELIGQKIADRAAPGPVAQGFVLHDLQEGGWLPVGGSLAAETGSWPPRFATVPSLGCCGAGAAGARTGSNLALPGSHPAGRRPPEP